LITAVLALIAMTLVRAGLSVLRARRAAADAELRRVLGPPPDIDGGPSSLAPPVRDGGRR
jgi:hypothetical protein